MAANKALTDTRCDFYVYVHRRATDGTVFYVGKGQRRRAHYTKDRNPHWHRTFEKHGLIVEITHSGLNEQEAFRRERELIAFYGRGNLCNLTDGGEGTSGVKLGPDHKAALMSACRRFHLGRKRTPEWGAKISAAKKGNSRAASGKLKGRKLSAETKAKISVAHMGLSHPHTDTSREKMRSSWTPERRAEQAERAAQHSRRPVICVETGVRFESIKAAGEWLASTSRYKTYFKISSCCGGKCAKAYGYHWRYAEHI